MNLKRIRDYINELGRLQQRYQDEEWIEIDEEWIELNVERPEHVFTTGEVTTRIFRDHNRRNKNAWLVDQCYLKHDCCCGEFRPVIYADHIADAIHALQLAYFWIKKREQCTP